MGWLRGTCVPKSALSPLTLLLQLLLLSCLSAEPLIAPLVPLKNTPQSSVCDLPSDTGTCQSWIARWYYDSQVEECRVFQYGGCEGNDNRFDSLMECQYHCAAGDHTLPPYMTRREHNDDLHSELEEVQHFTTTTTTTTTDASKVHHSHTTLAPKVPPEERGEQLTLPETGHHRSFTFGQSNAFIQLDGESIAPFQLRFSRELRLDFRTRLPHGLLAYHGVKERPSGLPPYALYVLVEKGQLKVVHVIGENSTSLIVGKGLNRDKWHQVQVRIDIAQAMLLARVDEHEAETTLLGLSPGSAYGMTSDLPSVVLVGGLSPEERLHGVKYIIGSFVGCIKDVTLGSGEEVDALMSIKPLIASKHDNVEEGCLDRCHSRHMLCFPGSRCINHYSHYSCDCFGTKYEGEYCDYYTATILTMRGYSYISYRVYDWKDRVHSSENRISIMFKTYFDNSTLIYASGESHKHHYLAASILNNSLYVEMDFGSGSMVYELGRTFGVTNNHWHKFTIYHHGSKVIVELDSERMEQIVPGHHHHLYLDPEICVGGGPNMQQRKGDSPRNNFVGSIKYAFFNDVSLLYELSKGNPRVTYISVLPPEFRETEVHHIPVTLPFPASHISWPLLYRNNMTLRFDFKSSKAMAVLASGNVTTQRGQGYWEIRVVNEEIRFELVPQTGENVTHLTSVTFDPRGAWHTVHLTYGKDQLKLVVDFHHEQTDMFGLQFNLGDKVMIGSSTRRNTGLVGCLRTIYVDGVLLELRSVVHSKHAIGQISLDNCQLVDPCSRPDACKHGGKCSVKNDRVVCDCKGTGYTGKNCHFAEFRKTCEELALLGYNEPDVYLIDIDGNGRFPPAHVKCEFQAEETKTIVEHNLPSQVDVRSTAYNDFQFNIHYREFTPEMLQELISHSLYCSQYIKYDCYKAPLDLLSATWFIPSAPKKIVDYIGDMRPGMCPCFENRTCVEPSRTCNCDKGEAKWHSDEGYYVTANSLGITDMVFLQQSSLEPDAQARITLGSLECVEENTQKYVVTFTSSQSYIEVPGWRNGDIAFSFRTTGEHAILLHQPPIRAHHPSFTVVLTNDYELTFNFTLNDGKVQEMKIQSDRRLNGGDWQKIWIDYNEHHVRFMINTRAQMVDLLPGEQFGPFEGSMFIGGAPDELLPESEVRQGLIGCFRGLVVNGEILNVYSYISVHLSEIIKDCKPSCDPNPCQNGAQCKEYWSAFTCECVNPWAHQGDYCEEDINKKGLTFRAENAFLKATIMAEEASMAQLKDLRSVLKKNILLNLRTHQPRALVFYAHDHLNNFVQLHFEGGDTVVFAFNSGRRIETIKVKHPGLSRGESVQVAIIRGTGSTALHVEDSQASVVAPLKLLTAYSNKPWENPEQETLAPQRPPVPPTEYFTLSLGGLDPEEFKSQPLPLPGFVGCLRGLKVEETDLMTLLPLPEGQEGEMVSNGCQMKCDERPCHNQGVCTEDFLRGESTCNCEHTSYFGPTCSEEKGASFSGESYLHRPINRGLIGDFKTQLAFSTSETGPKDSNIALMLITGELGYYLIIGLNDEGHLEVEERLSDGRWQAIVETSFTNGARHSVLYHRSGTKVTLLVDRQQVDLLYSVPADDEENGEETSERVGADIYLGGLKGFERARFKQYRNYSGCLSNVLIEVDNDNTRPLEEYMGFTKNRTDNEKVVAYNPGGVKSGFCAVFVPPLKGQLFPVGPLPNRSLSASDLQWKDKAWVEDPPLRVPYISPYPEKAVEDENSHIKILIGLSMIFVVVVIACLIELWRNNRAYKRRRRQQDDMWVMGQPPKYSDSVLNPSVKMVGFKNLVPDKSKATNNGTELQPLTRSEYEQVPLAPPALPPRARPHVSTSPTKPVAPEVPKKEVKNELDWDPIGEGAELLGGSLDNLSETLGKSMDDIGDGGVRQVEGDEEPPKQGTQQATNGIHSPTQLPISDAADSLSGPASPVRVYQLPQTAPWRKKPPPVFLSETLRRFDNPISYLGGPMRRNSQSRASKESVLSLD